MSTTDKRYQVFVSSTFNDLKEERREVIQALLELDCIPAGMEMFQAANQDQWSLIKKVIEDCDYYIVIVGGRYGSIGPDGISFTEMEYRYAVEKRKPILGFVHKAPGDIPSKNSENDPEAAKQLTAFRDLVQTRPCRYWNSAAELGSVVSRSVVRLIKDEPAVGWIRGDTASSGELATEALRLRKRIEELEAELRAARTQAPLGSELLSQGTDHLSLEYSFRSRAPEEPEYRSTGWSARTPVTWDDLFAVVAPSLIDEATDAQVKKDIDAFVRQRCLPHQKADPELAEKILYDFEVLPEAFKTIKVQLRALGLITLSDRVRSVKDSATYWKLTPYGDTTMVRLRAIQRAQTELQSRPVLGKKRAGKGKGKGGDDGETVSEGGA